MPVLEFVDAEREPFIIDASELIIGRGPACALVLDVDGADERHARVTLEADGSAVLRDLGSRGGTRKNGEFVTGAQKLEDGDRIEIGRAALVFRTRTPEPATVVPGAAPLDSLRTVRMAPVDLEALGLGHLVHLRNGDADDARGDAPPTKPQKLPRPETLMGAPRPTPEPTTAPASASFEAPPADEATAEERALPEEPTVMTVAPTSAPPRREPTDLASAPTAMHIAPALPPGLAPPARARKPTPPPRAEPASPMADVPTAQTVLPVLPTAPPLAPLAPRPAPGPLARAWKRVVDFLRALWRR